MQQSTDQDSWRGNCPIWVSLCHSPPVCFTSPGSYVLLDVPHPVRINLSFCKAHQKSLSCILPYVAIPRHVLSKARKESSDINTEQWLSRGKAHKESETNNTIMQHGTLYGFGREQSGLKLSQTKCYWTKYVCNCPPSCSTIKVQFSPKTLLQNPTVPLADYLNATLHIALSKTNRPIFYLFKMLLTNVLSVHTTFYCP